MVKFKEYFRNTDVLLIEIVTLVPSIIMVSYFHGRPGKDEWMKTELIGIPVNLLITFLCIFVIIYKAIWLFIFYASWANAIYSHPFVFIILRKPFCDGYYSRFNF